MQQKTDCNLKFILRFSQSFLYYLLTNLKVNDITYPLQLMSIKIMNYRRNTLYNILLIAI